MEGPFHPQDPQQRIGAIAGQDWPCRIDELALALKSSAAIAPPRFSNVTAAQVVDCLCVTHNNNLVVVDVREQEERMGGHIPSAVHMPHGMVGERLDHLVALWKAGKHIVVHCTRSLSRAPAAAQQLLRRLDQEGCSFPGRVVPQVSLMQGGFCGYMELLMIELQKRGLVEGGQDFHPKLLSDFDPSMWILRDDEVEGASRLAHVSECGVEFEQARQAVALMDQETSDELAFLVESRCTLTPPRVDSMSYIS